MAFFEFPYTRTDDSDLGRLIRAMKTLISEMVEFTDINSIKFADPINWNIATQYEPTTIVVDDEGNGYISKRAVPAGIALTDTTYWTRIFNFSDITDAIRSSIALNAGNSPTTPESLRKDDLVWWNGIIFRVLYDIAAGTAFSPNVNVEEYTVNERIQDLAGVAIPIAEDLAQERSERIEADNALTEELNNEIERSQLRYYEILESIDELRSDAEQWHTPYKDSATSSYVDTVNGDDSTAELENEEKPFKTLEAAWEAAGKVGNDFRFYFVTRGDYFLPARVITGAVIHFNALVDGVHIYTKNDYGNLFLYDAHINLRCEDTSGRIKLIARATENPAQRMQIEAEGSTVWVNRGDFDCSKLYIIQGSASLTNCTVNGWIDAWFANIRTYNLRVNGYDANPAIKMTTGTMRIENQPLQFGANTAASALPAIDLNTCMVRIGNNITQDDDTNSYTRILDAKSTIVFCSDSYWNRLTAQAPNESILNDNALRLRSAASPAVYPPI